MSKFDRWCDAVGEARAAIDNLESALDEFLTVQSECEESFNNMPPGLQQTERGQQFEAIAGVSLDNAKKLRDELEGIISDAESAT